MLSARDRKQYPTILATFYSNFDFVSKSETASDKDG